jgi:hypothetical protein
LSKYTIPRIKFLNPPAHVLSSHTPRSTNPLPVLYGFSPKTGNFTVAGPEYSGNLIIQPLRYRWKLCSRRGDVEREWLDVLFINRFDDLGLISLPQSVGNDLSNALSQLRLKRISLFGVWLCLAKYRPPFQSAFRVNVNSYYWATEIDCLVAERKKRDIRLKPWSKA